MTFQTSLRAIIVAWLILAMAPVALTWGQSGKSDTDDEDNLPPIIRVEDLKRKNSVKTTPQRIRPPLAPVGNVNPPKTVPAKAIPQKTAPAKASDLTTSKLESNKVQNVPISHATFENSQTALNDYRSSCGGSSCGGCSSCGFSNQFGNARSCFSQYFSPYCVRPFGSFTRRTLCAQIQNGIDSQLVFYRLHFSFDPANQVWQLTGAGQRQADKIVYLGPGSYGRVVIEPTGNLDWDEGRRQAALSALHDRGLTLPLESLVIARPPASGISGDEAILLYQQSLQPSPFIGLYSDRTFTPNISTTDTGNSGQ